VIGNVGRPAPRSTADGWAPGEILFVGAVLLVGASAAIVWGGAALAALLAGDHLDASLGDAVGAAARLPGRLKNPAAAWPTSAGTLPGPRLYWVSQALVVAIVAAVAVLAWQLFRPTKQRDGLGVERSARFARRRDLRRLAVKGPTSGRIILGRSGGALVAAEERTGVCVVGPSQSGKTSGLCVPALLELGKGAGAVIAASVKGDLYAVTEQRRASVGDVKVFDPTCVVTQQSATWTPLRAAQTVTGAQAAARGLYEVAGRSRLEDADFWMSAAKELLWPLLFVAARTKGTMAHVVRWVTTQDRPTFNSNGQLAREGEVTARIRKIEAADAAAQADQPVIEGRPVRPSGTPPIGPPGERALATAALTGIWTCDERTRSAIYTTARTVIEAWSDPVVAKAAEGCDITPEWLLNGDNTLYIVAPARDQARFRPVFASLVADLVNGAFDAAARRENGSLEHQLLVLLDEAANICPVKELPTWCSTCPSHGITLITVWQDRSQQHLRYGREGAETIWNNSGAKVILSGLADHATAELTGLLGEEEHERTGRRFDLTRGRRTLSTQTATRRLVTEDSLRRQRPGQALLVYKDRPPARLALRPWHKDRTLRALKEGTR